MTPRLSFHPQAEREIAAAAAWYEERVSGLGVEFVAALDAVFAAVLENPLRYPIAKAYRRRALLGRFPYALIFELADSEGIRILSCHHHRRCPRRWRLRERVTAYAVEGRIRHATRSF